KRGRIPGALSTRGYERQAPTARKNRASWHGPAVTARPLPVKPRSVHRKWPWSAERRTLCPAALGFEPVTAKAGELRARFSGVPEGRSLLLRACRCPAALQCVLGRLLGYPASAAPPVHSTGRPIRRDVWPKLPPLPDPRFMGNPAHPCAPAQEPVVQHRNRGASGRNKPSRTRQRRAAPP